MACVHSMLHAHGVTDTAAQQRTRRRHAVTVLAQTRGRLGPPATQPPLAPKAPKEFVLHGDSQIDEFAWLRDPSRRQPHVMGHLLAENNYSRAMLRRLAPVTQQLQTEMESTLWQSAMAHLTLVDGLGEPSAEASGNTAGALTRLPVARPITRSTGTPGAHAAALEGRQFGAYAYARQKHGCGSTALTGAGSTYAAASKAPAQTHHVHMRVPVTAQAPAATTAAAVAIPIAGSSSDGEAKARHQDLQQAGAAVQPAVHHPAGTVLLDEAVRSCWRPGYVLHSFEPSPSFSHYAFTECTASEPAAGTKHLTYTLHVHDADTGQPVVSPVEGVHGPTAWGPCGTQLHFISGGGYTLKTLDLPATSTTFCTTTSPTATAAEPRSQLGPGQKPPAPFLSVVSHQPDYFLFQFRRVSLGPGAYHPHQQLLLCEAIDSNMHARQLLALVPVNDTRTSDSGLAQQYVWREVMATSLGSRILYVSMEGPHDPGLLVWTYSCAHPNGELLWSDTASSSTNTSRTQLVLPHREEWAVWDVQVSAGQVLVSLRQAPQQHAAQPVACSGTAREGQHDENVSCSNIDPAAGGGDAAAPLAAAAASARSWQQRDQQAQPTQCAALRVRFEVYQLTEPAAATVSTGPGACAGARKVQLVLQAATEGDVGGLPFAELQPPVWMAPQQPMPQLLSAPESGKPTQSVTPPRSVALAFSAFGQPLSIATLRLCPATSSTRADQAQSTQAEEVGENEDADTHSSIVHTHMWAQSADGTPVPISLAYDTAKVQPGNARAAAVLQVYGAYGTPDALGFTPTRAALLSRGVVVAVAHVRGGGQLGPAWHEAGRGMHKHKGVEDVIACAQQLVGSGLCHPRRLALVAGSAGGWVAGAALNAQPQLFAAAVLTAPSLDILSTMTQEDDSRHELGDIQQDERAYKSVRGWAPYDNLPPAATLLEAWVSAVKAARAQQQPLQLRPVKLFPAVLVRTGLTDTVVNFWEPAKWVARLRWRLAAADGALRQSMQRDVEAVPEVLLQVRPGGHSCFGNVQDDAVMCAFVLHHVTNSS